jgi:hypothetical protein
MRVVLLFAAVTLSLWLPETSWAQALCQPRASLIAGLQDSYGETPRAIAVTLTGNVVELLRSDEQRTFTIIVTTPDGMSCLLAAGRDWESIALPAKGRGL